MIFRFDDVCQNADMQSHFDFTEYILRHINCSVMWAVSPIISKSEKETQRVFPRKWNALSDFRQHYKLDNIGVPGIHPRVAVASHGLVHVDHRLLSFGAQEMSILLSCSIIGATTFVPPFNKWNTHTEQICYENKIKLVKFEEGWLSMEYNEFDPSNKLWYLHAREWTLEKLQNWMNV